MSNIAVKVENLNKTFKLYRNSKDRFKSLVHPLRKKYHRDYHALKNVSFEIKRGESVGVLGKNGAGKSTLLKILTGVMTPTSGKVVVNGRVAALLELGAGFNPDLTGMENIFFQAAIMGLDKEETFSKVPQILEFADIGDFINQPVKTYSSGMFSRLAFAIAIHVDPDILIVDEALSVGDSYFQMKCFAKFQQFLNSNKTIIFVTHNSQQVISYCSRAILISDGEVTHNSVDVKGVVTEYEKRIRNLDEVFNSSLKGRIDHTRRAFIADFRILNSLGVSTKCLTPDELITIEVTVNSKENIESVVLGISFKNSKAQTVWSINTLKLVRLLRLQAGKTVLRFNCSLHMQPETYFVYIGLADITNGRSELDQCWEFDQFDVVADYSMPEGFVYSSIKFDAIHEQVEQTSNNKIFSSN